MSAPYTGVCVGGPMDGKIIAYDSNMMIVAASLREPEKNSVYYFEGTNTWRHQSLSIPAMISHLAEAYVEWHARQDDGK